MAEAEHSGTSQLEQPLLSDQLFALLHNWLNRLDILGGLLVAETRLNVKTTVLLLVLLVVAVVVGLGLWFSILVWLGVVAYTLVHNLILAVTIVILLQVALLGGLVVSMRHAQSKLGYRHSRSAVASFFNQQPIVDRVPQEGDDAGGSNSGELRAGC